MNDLSGQTSKDEAKVWPLWKHREGSSKKEPRLLNKGRYFDLKFGSKKLPLQRSKKVTDRRVYATYIVLTRQVTITNEDPVLNSAAARLGQALRESQDALVRDQLESSASIINCVDFAQYKSSLIDLELAA